MQKTEARGSAMVLARLRWRCVHVHVQVERRQKLATFFISCPQPLHAYKLRMQMLSPKPKFPPL